MRVWQQLGPGAKWRRKPKLDAKQIRHIKALLRDPNTSVAELAKRLWRVTDDGYKHCGVVPPKKLIEERP